MIRAMIRIPKYGWTLYAFFAVDTYYTYEILDMMRRIGAPKEIILKAHKNLLSGNLDSGLCFGNKDLRKAVLVTSLTSSPDEFFDSIVHELRHLQQYIADDFDISEHGEEVCYLIGDIARALFPYCRSLLCEHCRQHLK